LAVGRFQSVCSDDAGEEANNAPVALDESIESNICIWRLAEGNSKLDGEEMGEEEWKPRARLMVQKMADFQVLKFNMFNSFIGINLSFTYFRRACSTIC
jgi:hypothetical protein